MQTLKKLNRNLTYMYRSTYVSPVCSVVMGVEHEYEEVFCQTRSISRKEFEVILNIVVLHVATGVTSRLRRRP